MQSVTQTLHSPVWEAQEVMGRVRCGVSGGRETGRVREGQRRQRQGGTGRGRSETLSQTESTGPQRGPGEVSAQNKLGPLTPPSSL